jgi:citrate lyase alpha subunit
VTVCRPSTSWTEGTITFATQPSPSCDLAVSSMTATPSKYATIDVTDLVQDWVDSVVPNNGVVLTSSNSIVFIAKEGGSLSHDARSTSLSRILAPLARAGLRVLVDRVAHRVLPALRVRAQRP